MTHKKSTHTDKLAGCRKFSAGKCEVGDVKCWFSHVNNVKTVELSGVECNICANNFDTLSEFLHHKKLEHKESVKRCRNNACRFGDTKCWFVHEEETILEEIKIMELQKKYLA